MRKILSALSLSLLLTGCSVASTPPTSYTLQHPWTRQVVYCPAEHYTLAANNLMGSSYCAKFFENGGFEKLQHLTYMPARFDNVREGSYPERRWREGERVPRW